MNLSESTCRDLFAAAHAACLGTVDAEGRPHLVPVVFAVRTSPDAGADGRVRDRVYFAVDAKPKRHNRLKRLDNILLHPAVSLLADHDDADWTRLWWVRADGAARIVTEEDERARPIRLLSDKYPQYAKQAPQGPVVEIEISRWSGWAYAPDAIGSVAVPEG